MVFINNCNKSGTNVGAKESLKWFQCNEIKDKQNNNNQCIMMAQTHFLGIEFFEISAYLKIQKDFLSKTR